MMTKELAIKILSGDTLGTNEQTHEAVCMAVKALTEQKRGHWIVKGVIEYTRSFGGILYEPVYKCSCCGNLTESYVRMDKPIFPEDADYPNYCPNCGARMDGDDT